MDVVTDTMGLTTIERWPDALTVPPGKQCRVIARLYQTSGTRLTI